MIKNKTPICSCSQFFSMLFFLLFITPLMAQDTSDWAKPLQSAQNLLDKKEYLSALREFKTHAELGNGLAQFNVALFYDFGWGVSEHRDMACVWYKKAALSNMPGAMQQLGQCYQYGTGIEQNNKEAILWYTKAYEQGIYAAYCEAGLILLERMPKNITKGIQLCIKGAELGAINAQQNLAKWYFYGDYLPQDYHHAYRWLNFVAGIKSPESAYLLAQYYDRGIDMEIDTKQALKWYEIAASQGYKKAYLPTAALYWLEFTQNNNPALLAKTYLWTRTSCRVNDVDQRLNKSLMEQILKVMPTPWQIDLNSQVETHLAKFNKLGQNTDC